MGIVTNAKEKKRLKPEDNGGYLVGPGANFRILRSLFNECHIVYLCQECSTIVGWLYYFIKRLLP